MNLSVGKNVALLKALMIVIGSLWSLPRSIKSTTSTNFSNLQQSKHHNAIGRAHIDFAAGYHRRNELVAWTKLIPPSSGLVAVVEFIGKIGSVISVEDGRCSILHSPQDTVAGAVRRNAGR
jgi:hypothetical protein